MNDPKLLAFVDAARTTFQTMLGIDAKPGAFERGHDELGETDGVEVHPETSRHLASLERARQPNSPAQEDSGEPLPESLVDVRQLGGKIAHGTAPDTVALPLVVEDPLEEVVDLGDGVRRGIRERRFERPFGEPMDQPVDDGEPQLFLAPEVVVEVALADAGLAEHVVQRGVVVAVHVDQPARRLEDRLARRAPLPCLRSDFGRLGRRHLY